MGAFENILRTIDEEDVLYIYLLFVDIKGHFHSIQTNSSNAYRIFSYGYDINISNIEGFEDVGVVNLYPDFDTFVIHPWRPQQGKCSSIICNINPINNREFNFDSRLIAIESLKNCINKELFFTIIPSIQFYMFHTDEDGNPLTVTHDKSDEYDFGPWDLGVNLRRDITITLQDCDIMFTSCTTKRDCGLQEINLNGADLKRICDDINFSKEVCKTIAKRHGVHASFMPKPTNGVKGSRMQIKFMCQNDEETNIFYEETDKNKISSIGYSFIAGILKYIREISIITNPLINSYKKLASDKVPRCIAWTGDSSNDSVILQVVHTYIENDIMIQINSIDVACNPYLTLSLLIEAGIEGIIDKLTPPQEVNSNLFNKTDTELQKLSIKSLPMSMGEALDLFKKSKFAKKILGDAIYYHVINIKEKEWTEYRRSVSEWEVNQYLLEY